jgi:tetratricopeptide (TPR) repeat protein
VQERRVSDLPDAVHSEITRLSEEGNQLLEAGEYAKARLRWQRAWDLLPEPRDSWEAATWLLTSIGDSYYSEQRFTDALVPLQQAVFCPNGLGNPYIHLRLGQVQFELGNIDRAKDELARAFIGGGDEVFEGDDPKYWRFIREILRPSADEIGE